MCLRAVNAGLVFYISVKGRVLAMKTKVILMAICTTMVFCMSACSGNTEISNDDQDGGTEISTTDTGETGSPEDNTMPEGEPAGENGSADDTIIGGKTMIMKIGDTSVSVDWEDNQAVEALKDMAEEGDITIQMSMYGGFEQVGAIGKSLPRDDKQMTTSSGDIVLYSGDQMVVFYGSNSWSYTKLGHISDKDGSDMTALLSNGDVTITISLGR